MRTPEEVYMELAGQYGSECKKCGNCCKSFDNIRLRSSDVARLNNLDSGKFVQREGRKYFLSNESGCPYFNGTECKIHKIKPFECRMYPFLTIDEDNPFHIYGSCEASKELLANVMKVHENIGKNPSNVMTEDDAKLIKVILLARYVRDYEVRDVRKLMEKCELLECGDGIPDQDFKDMCYRYMESNFAMIKKYQESQK
jgi:Fe-S-cluster containining protein